MDTGPGRGAASAVDDPHLIVGERDPGDPWVQLLECLAEGGIECIDGTVPFGGHFEIPIAVTDGNRGLAGGGGTRRIAAETAMVSLEFEERIMATEFLADQEFE